MRKFKCMMFGHLYQWETVRWRLGFKEIELKVMCCRVCGACRWVD